MLLIMERYEGTSLAAIGQRLKLTREALELSQVELCRRAKLATNAYNQYETGKTRPAVENAIAICETFQLTLDWIYRGDPSGLRYDLADKLRLRKIATVERHAKNLTDISFEAKTLKTRNTSSKSRPPRA